MTGQEGRRKRKDNGKGSYHEIFCPLMFRGDLSIKISWLSHHAFHALFIPSLVSVSFEELNSFEAPRFCHVRTSAVSLVMSPVTRNARFCPSNLRMKANACMGADML
jgi:hypothetical protein